MNDIINVTNKSSISFDDLGLTDDEIGLIKFCLSFATKEKQKIIEIPLNDLDQSKIDTLYRISQQNYTITEQFSNNRSRYDRNLFSLAFTTEDDLRTILGVTFCIDSLLAFILGHIDKKQMKNSPFYGQIEWWNSLGEIDSIEIYNTK